MSDEVGIDGVEYVSSKRASELSGYAQDYIGQLARGGYIDAKRVGGLWHVSIASLNEYEKNAVINRSRPQERIQPDEPDSLISFDGKDYVSAARAAELTGYHQDYVGQLARGGTIIGRQVGNRWYVDREAILAHKTEKDRLLGAVQAQSVGIVRNTSRPQPESEVRDLFDADEYLTYTKDTNDLIPPLRAGNESVEEHFEETSDKVSSDTGKQAIPIRINRISPGKMVRREQYVPEIHPKEDTAPRKGIFYGTITLATLVVAALIFFGLRSVERQPVYTMANTTNALTAMGDFFEKLIAHELIYERTR